jgi:hypothetical protein
VRGSASTPSPPAQPNATRLWIDLLHVAENHVDVALAPKEGSQRLGNVTAVQ